MEAALDALLGTPPESEALAAADAGVLGLPNDDEGLLDAILVHDLEQVLDSAEHGSDAFEASLPSLQSLQPSADLSMPELQEIELGAPPVTSDCLSSPAPAPVAGQPEGEDPPLAEVHELDSCLEHDREVELLSREVTFLEAQCEFLRFKADVVASEASASPQHNTNCCQHGPRKRRAHDERDRRDAATRRRNMLADLMQQQKRSLGELLGLLAQASPLTHYRTTLMTPMESFIRLDKDPVTRRRKLLAMRDEKVAAVREFISTQSRGLDPTRDFFYVDSFQRFGKLYTVDFSVSLLSATSVNEVAQVIQDQFVVPRDGVSRLLGGASSREYFDGLEDTFLHARTVERVDLPPRSSGHGRGFVVQESNAVFFLKRFGAEAKADVDGSGSELTVLMSDFVDVDELHPYHSHSRVRKDISVGITLQRHVGLDGVPGVVMKRFSFVKHHLQARAASPGLEHAISARVLLWGQAVRLCIAARRHQKQKLDERQRIWHTHTFPRVSSAVAVTPPTQARPRTTDG